MVISPPSGLFRGCCAYLSLAASTTAVTGLFLLLVLAFYRLYLHPLSRVPGPRLAAISNCWYAYQVRNGRMLQLGKSLHKQYGSVVRVGPNNVWFESKNAFKMIYSPTHGYEKSDFYLATALLRPKVDAIFRLRFFDTLDLLAERDMKRYRLQRRLIGPIYSTHNVKNYERGVDEVLKRVISQIESLDGSQVDLKEWMHIITVECLGAVSLSWSPGYLKAKSDGHSGKHAYLGWRRKSVLGLFPMAAVAGGLFAPFARAFSILWGVTYQPPKDGFRPFFPAVQKKVTKRIKAAFRANAKDGNHHDIVADLIRLHEQRPEFKDNYLRRMAMTNFGAGHETVTSTLTSAIAMIGSHLNVQSRVVDEARQVSDPISFDDAVSLKYTQASIKEAQRLYPVIGMSLPRKVPPEGMRLDGLFIPPGTTVGCNPVSLHRNTDIFGSDAEDYNPRRWLDGENVKAMERYNLIYGGGPRTCPGRYLAEMLVSKIVPTLVKHFDIQITMPPEGEICYYFMAMLTGVQVRFLPKRLRYQPQLSP